MPTLTLAFKGKTLQVLPLSESAVTIGRDPGHDIHIDSLAVEPEHARIELHDNHWVLIQGQHDNTTFVNHKPLHEHPLQNNDLVRIGKHTLQFRDDDPATANIDEPTLATPPTGSSPESPSATATGLLQVMSGKNLGKTIKLQSGLTDLSKLGMSPALIALRSNGYFISNLAKDYTLSVGDQEIGDKSWPLHDGDMIKLNQLTLQFHLHA